MLLGIVGWRRGGAWRRVCCCRNGREGGRVVIGGALLDERAGRGIRSSGGRVAI